MRGRVGAAIWPPGYGRGMDTQAIIHRLEAIKMEVARLRPAVAPLSDPPEPSDLMDDGARQRLRELVQEQRRLMEQLGRKRPA